LNIGSSWISREAIFGLAFLVLAALYALVWFMQSRGKSNMTMLRVVLAVLTALAALCLVVSTGMAYTIVKTIPAWNTPLTIAFLAASACTMGILLIAGALILAGTLAKDTAKGEAQGEAQTRLWTGLQMLPKAAALLLVVLIAVEILRLVHLNISAEAAAQSLSLLCESLLPLLLVRWIIGLVLPLALMLYAWLSSKTGQATVNKLVVVSLIAVLAGELLARMLFFLSAVHI